MGKEGAPPQSSREPDDGRAAEEGQRVEEDIDQLLDETRKERDEYLELARRTKADFENYRRRAAEDASGAEVRGRAELSRQLVPVLDNLERALVAAGIDPTTDDNEDAEADGAGLAHGVRLVYRELRDALTRAGLEAYDPEGERFDPEWHEALATRPQEGVDSGVVLETVERGYRLGEQVMRPARVVVSQ